MICPDCARGADIAAARTTGELDTVAAHLGYTPEHEAAANHDRPGGGGRIIAYIHRAADGTQTTLDPAEIWTVRQAIGPEAGAVDSDSGGST